jgi:valyl-tRNA synthetase
MLARITDTVRDATAAFDEFDYARALERTEATFWWFCDDYVELVKGRAYSSQGDDAAGSALAAMRLALSALQRLFAPFMPFTAESVWRWWNEESVHHASWPTAEELASTGDDSILDTVGEILGQIRRAKTEAKTSQRTAVARCIVRGDARTLEILDLARADLTEAGSVREWSTESMPQGSAISVDVELDAS